MTSTQETCRERIVSARASASAMTICGVCSAAAEAAFVNACVVATALAAPVNIKTSRRLSGSTFGPQAFNDKNNKQYHDRDLYVFCYNMADGKFTAHPNPGIMGTDVRALKIKDDPIGQRSFDGVKNAPEGTVSTFDYKFPKPGMTEPLPKQSFETRIGDQVCGVGYYK
jgi:hypothetical protein